MNFPKVNTDECVGCGACLDICPDDAIILENGKAKILENKCRNCRACANSCPTGAIS